VNNDAKNLLMATCFPGSRHENACSGKFGADCKDRGKKREGAPETEV